MPPTSPWPSSRWKPPPAPTRCWQSVTSRRLAGSRTTGRQALGHDSRKQVKATKSQKPGGGGAAPEAQGNVSAKAPSKPPAGKARGLVQGRFEVGVHPALDAINRSLPIDKRL